MECCQRYHRTKRLATLVHFHGHFPYSRFGHMDSRRSHNTVISLNIRVPHFWFLLNLNEFIAVYWESIWWMTPSLHGFPKVSYVMCMALYRMSRHQSNALCFAFNLMAPKVSAVPHTYCPKKNYKKKTSRNLMVYHKSENSLNVCDSVNSMHRHINGRYYFEL